MAEFARIDKNNIVKGIYFVDDVNLINEDGEEEEDFGIAHLNKLHGTGFTWIQSSPNGSFRKNHAGKGFTYDKAKDAFIPPKPYDSWTLDEDTCQWTAPVSYSGTDDIAHSWNDTDGTWEEK